MLTAGQEGKIMMKMKSALSLTLILCVVASAPPLTAQEPTVSPDATRSSNAASRFPDTQGKPVIVVQPFTVATGVRLPYDIKLMQTQLVAEFKVELGKEFDILAEA